MTVFELKEPQCNRLISIRQGSQGLSSSAKRAGHAVEVGNLPRSWKAPGELKDRERRGARPESREEKRMGYQRMTKESRYSQALLLNEVIQKASSDIS